MAQRNDQVFQLSLTEIAFTIAFLLLLLLGYLVFMEQARRLAAETYLIQVQTAERATAALESAKSALASQLQGAGVPNPNEAIVKLIAAEEGRTERDQLREKVQDLEAKLTALTELKSQLEQATTSSRPQVMQEEVLSALALQEQVRAAVEADASAAQQITKKSEPASSSASGRPPSPRDAPFSPPPKPSDKAARDRQAIAAVRQALDTNAELRKQLKEKLDRQVQKGKEGQIITEVVDAAKAYESSVKSGLSPDAVKKENSDLRGQVAFLKNRLDARGGRDFPPCWADETGKVEFLFSIEVRSDSVAITPAWPTRREATARTLPGMDAVIGGAHSHQEFIGKVQGIFNWSKSQNPECRHYVQLKSTIADAVQSDRARLMVENFFYKVEARR